MIEIANNKEIERYIKKYRSVLSKLKILSIESKEHLDLLKKGIDKLKLFIYEGKYEFKEGNEKIKLATSSIKSALFIRHAIESLIYAIVIFNNNSIKVKKDDWNIKDFIDRLDLLEINWTPKKFIDLEKSNLTIFTIEKELQGNKYFTSNSIKKMYSKTSKIIHDVKPWISINNESKNGNKKQDLKTFLTINLKAIENEFNKLNDIHKNFFEKINNHSIFIENNTYLITVKDFEIYNTYKIS